MSKAVLIMDMPESCEICPCACYTEGAYHDYCKAKGYQTKIDCISKPDWCPLLELPERKEFKGVDGITADNITDRVYQSNKEAVALGWNACLDAIEGVEHMSRVLPILFNTDMVRAILDWRKTVTRRLGRWKIRNFNVDGNGIVTATMVREIKNGKVVRHFAGGTIMEFLKVFSDYQPDDILYVRETWALQKRGYMYKANWEPFGMGDVVKWKPSIHMPKEGVRIWLKVTDVRVERLQDITEEQASAEGIGEFNIGMGERGFALSCDSKAFYDTAVGAFVDFWYSTIKKSDLDRYGLDANPWVWAIEFERCEKPDRAYGEARSQQRISGHTSGMANSSKRNFDN